MGLNSSRLSINVRQLDEVEEEGCIEDDPSEELSTLNLMGSNTSRLSTNFRRLDEVEEGFIEDDDPWEEKEELDDLVLRVDLEERDNAAAAAAAFNASNVDGGSGLGL